MKLGGPSFWFDSMGGLPPPRPSLNQDLTVDVAIIGAGFTGLWTAYYLKKADPSLRIAVLEARVAGFGASGRNGGWLTGGFAWSHDRYAQERGAPATRAFVQAMNDTVAEVLRVASLEGIEADIRLTDELSIATNTAQLQRLTGEYQHRSHWGEADRLTLLSAEQARLRIAAPGILGALKVAGVARINPAKLVRQLSNICVKIGVELYENTKVIEYAAGILKTDKAQIQAQNILRCTEGFTAEMQGVQREWLPLNSAQIATAPLPEEIWSKIGMQAYEIIGDAANVYCYCQRTADNRLLVGSRGLPYRFGSRLDADGVPDPVTIARLREVLVRLFPAAAQAPITHAWCGTLGVPRDWCTTIGFDPATGLGFAGGYVGVGVSTSNLAGRALCDLVLRRDTPLTHLPLINRTVRRWELEPLRWLAVRGMYAALHLADRREARPGAQASRVAKFAYWLGGRS